MLQKLKKVLIWPQEYPLRWNAYVKLHPQDRFLKATLLKLIPRWVIPNHLTVLRMLLTPVVLYVLWRQHYGAGLILF